MSGRACRGFGSANREESPGELGRGPSGGAAAAAAVAIEDKRQARDEAPQVPAKIGNVQPNWRRGREEARESGATGSRETLLGRKGKCFTGSQMRELRVQRRRYLRDVTLLFALLLIYQLGQAPDKTSNNRTAQPPSDKSISSRLVDCLQVAAESGNQANSERTSAEFGLGKASKQPKTTLIKVSNSQLKTPKRNRNYLQTKPQQGEVEENDPAGRMQISITPRNGQHRADVDSNTILKCLISAQASRFAKKFTVTWTRFMYDENVYEQLDMHSGQSDKRQTNMTSDQQEQTTTTTTTTSPTTTTFNRQQQLRDFLSRSRQDVNAISELLIEATLSINQVKASDNATYFCTASTNDGSSEQNQAKIDLIVLSKPIVQLERVHPTRDSKSALIYWQLISDGNLPIKRTILMVKNSSSLQVDQFKRPQLPVEVHPASDEEDPLASIVIDSEHNLWQRIDIPGSGEQAGLVDQNELSSAEATGDSVVRADVDITSSSKSYSREQDNHLWLLRGSNRHQRAHNLTSLLPGVTYNLRLAAINDMGQSEWSHLSTTMPSDLPAQISEIFLLSRSNDSLAIGWRRPSYDVARTIRYEMQLFDLNRTLTLDANTNTSVATNRTNFMYIFVNLNPGTDYHFHVRACSKVGCSAYSSPKLLASTLDGESDEPMDVELSCHLDSGNVSVSWMPPMNPRGQLQNYTISFDYNARFKNNLGLWSVYEWRSTMETADNQSLSIETGGILIPNTNYSVRVCANNRSKHCGRLSPLSSRTQCATPPELPKELPPNIRLTTKTLNSNSDGSGKPPETLALELPAISNRNGTIDCIQIVLIRLPRSFAGSNSALDQYLPREPSDIKLVPFQDRTDSRQTADREPAKQVEQEKAFAYLAEEVDQEDISREPLKTVLLGDGLHTTCQSTLESSQSHQAIRRSEIFDGNLAPRTYYTGFIKLLLVTKQGGETRILSKYSNYLQPVKTGDSLLEIRETLSPVIVFVPQFSNLFGSNGYIDLDDVAANLKASLRNGFEKIYNFTSKLVSENVKLDSLSKYIMHSSPLMQLFEIGIIVFLLSLLLLFVIYIITLPSTMRRKRRRKMKRQLYHKNHEPIVCDKLAGSTRQEREFSSHVSQINGVQEKPAMMLMPSRQDQNLDTSETIDRAHMSNQIENNRKPEHANRECPIHSSPMSRIHPNSVNQSPKNSDLQPNLNGYIERENINDEQPYLSQQQQQPSNHHRHHHHHLHLDSGYQTTEGQAGKYEATDWSQEQFERNCRTARRRVTNSGQVDMNQINPAGNFTLGHQRSALTLARKIGKSIPMSHFKQVFECRLRNGWLREEYEQLLSKPAEIEVNSNMRLRPQLVVSRDDTVSALISGEQYYDAGLLKMLVGDSEKKIISAKSPLDADSTWDFWRLVYEQEVGTIVMLTQNEDPNTGETRCAQYWPTCDNEETTILSPCNEYVQKSDIPPAKFKIRQETLNEEGREDDIKIRRLTLIVMATKPGENDANEEHTNATDDYAMEEDDENLVIVERNIIHLQFHHWNTGTMRGQTRLVKFIEFANERYTQSRNGIQPNPMLVHCSTGLGRSGLFAAMSFIMDGLSLRSDYPNGNNQEFQKVNIFQLVTKLRSQREMIVSPYRFYEQLYQLISSLI